MQHKSKAFLFLVGKFFYPTSEHHNIIPSGGSLFSVFDIVAKGRVFFPDNLVHDENDWLFIIINVSIDEVFRGESSR